MKLNSHRVVSAGFMLFLTVSGTQALASPNDKVYQSASNPTVCQWLTRNGNKLYLCGAVADVEAMVQEARHYQKPALALNDIPRINNQPSIMETAPIKTAPIQAAYVEASTVKTMPSRTPFVKVAAVNAIPIKAIPIKVAPIKTDAIASADLIASTKPKPVDQNLPLRKKTSSKGFMVQSIGQVKEIKPKLIAISDKDYQILKRKNRISLGVYSHYKNALRRQRNLAALGIYSELIDRSLKTTVQTPSSKKKVQTPLEPKKSRIKKRSTSNAKGFLVASVDNADETITLLKKAKDKHFQVLHSAPYANRVSLGIYNTHKFALIRQRAMTKYGIATVIINRDKALNTGFASVAIQTKLSVMPNAALPKKAVLKNVTLKNVTLKKVLPKIATPKKKLQKKAVVKNVLPTKVKVITPKKPSAGPSQEQLDRVIQLISSN